MVTGGHVQRACLDQFAFLQNFTVAKESYQFKVLNKVYLQNFLHGWVVNHEMNLMMLPIHAKSFVNRLHLVLQISKIPLASLRLQLFYVFAN
jgi:hypothetical protein